MSLKALNREDLLLLILDLMVFGIIDKQDNTVDFPFNNTMIFAVFTNIFSACLHQFSLRMPICRNKPLFLDLWN